MHRRQPVSQSAATDPVPVTVKVEKINPILSVVYYGTYVVSHKGEERTMVRFTLDSDGNVTDTNDKQASLVGTLVQPRP